MRILLVKPKARLRTVRGLERLQRLEPLELGYLAAVVPPPHEVRVLDLRLHRAADRAYLRALSAYRPDVVGISGYSHEASEVKRLAAVAKRHLPKTFVVVGGHHATVAAADYDVDGIDAIVRGEGCAPFAALVAALAAGRPPEGIPHLLRTGADFDDAACATWPQFPDPATLPRPRRDLWSWRDYYCVWVSERPTPWEPLFPPTAMVRTSWGCRMLCTFCIVPNLCGGVHMPRPVDSVVDEIAALDADHVYFSDDENFIDEEFALALADGLARRGVQKRYFAWTRATTVNRSPALLRRWREVGLDAAFLGFEFPTDDELRAVKKGGSVAGNQRAHETLRELGIAVHAAFMLMPEWDEAAFARLRDFVAAMPPAQFSFTVCTPSPGTADYAAMKERIWTPDPFSLHDCMHPLTATALPLTRFSELYADLLATAGKRHPMRLMRHPIRLADAVRVAWADNRWRHAFGSLYRDYPERLWGQATGDRGQ